MGSEIVVQVALLVLTLAIFFSVHYVSKQSLSKLRSKTRTTVQATRHLAEATRLLARAKSTSHKPNSLTILKHALSEAQMALSLDPRDPHPHVIKAQILEFMGHESSALKSIDSALNLPRAKTLAGKERGELLVKRAELKLGVNRKRRVDSAAEDLKEAVRLSEGKCDSKAFCLLSECYELKGLKGKALEDRSWAGWGSVLARKAMDQLGL